MTTESQYFSSVSKSYAYKTLNSRRRSIPSDFHHVLNDLPNASVVTAENSETKTLKDIVQEARQEGSLSEAEEEEALSSPGAVSEKYGDHGTNFISESDERQGPGAIETEPKEVIEPIRSGKNETWKFWGKPGNEPVRKKDGSVFQRSCSFRHVRRKRSWESQQRNSTPPTESHYPLSGRVSAPLRRRESLLERFRKSVVLRSESQQDSFSSHTPPDSADMGSPRWFQKVDISLLIGLCFREMEETLTVSVEKIKVQGENFGDFYIALFHYRGSSLMESSQSEVVHVGTSGEATFFTCVEEYFVFPARLSHMADTKILIEIWKKDTKDRSEFAIGKISISPESGTVAKAHWSQFHHTIGYPATMWHNINA